MNTRLLRWSPAAILVIAGSTQSLAAGPFAATLKLSSLNGTNGFVCNGIDASDQSGNSVSSAGDVNDDGIDDLIIGARSDPNVNNGAGKSYVVFGRCVLIAEINGDNIVDSADLGILLGQFGTPGPGADINGDGVVDTADLGILLGGFGTSCI